MQTDLMLSLPKEIWSLILDLVPQRDRLNHRLVNKQWRHMIDECSTFKVKYSSNDKSESLLDHVLQLRIRTCEFSGVKGQMRPLVHPLLVREITLGPCVTPENTKAILTNCCNVEYLRYFVTERSDVSFGASVNHGEYLRNLRRLKSIELGILFFGPRNASVVTSCIKTLFGNKDLLLTGLSELIIHFKMVKEEWQEFYAFVNRHKNTLRKISIHHQCFCESGSWVNNKNKLAGTSDWGFPADDKESCLHWFSENLNLTSIMLMKGTHYKCECNGELLWSKLLSSQCEISVLCTDLVPNTSVVKDLVRRCAPQLVSLKLYDIPLGIDACFDFSIFQNCNQLRELSLHFLNSEVIVMRVSNTSDDSGNGVVSKRYAECYNLQMLPKSLRKLSIKGCDILTDTLKEMSGCLPSLQELHLVDPGSPSRMGYGVTFSVLLSIFENLPDLRRFSVDKRFLNLSDQTVNTKFAYCRMFQNMGLINSCDVLNLCGESSRCVNLSADVLFSNNRATFEESVTVLFDLSAYLGSEERSELISYCKTDPVRASESDDATKISTLAS